jgi:hypothetical protein
MKNRRKIILDIIKSKSFIGSFFFAIALWVYSSLNSEFITYKRLPLSINLPNNRAIASDIPKNVTLEVKGTGWQLLNLLFINSNAGCRIDLSEIKDLDSLKISRKEYLKGLYNVTNVNTIEFAPESFVLQTGTVSEKDVTIRSNLRVNPYEGYMVVGDIDLHPNMIVIKGNYNVVNNINYWNTKKMIIEGVSESFETIVHLSDSLSNIINLSDQTISAHVDIQQIAEQTLYDIPIKIKGTQLSQKHKIMPEFITVTIRGGINQLYDFNPENISASLNSDDILNDSTGLIKPEIKIPKNIQIVNITPKYLTHKIIDFIPKKQITSYKF